MIVGIANIEGDLLGTIGVFLSDAGSLLTALGAIHYEQKRGKRICDERFQAFRDGLDEGVGLEESEVGKDDL